MLQDQNPDKMKLAHFARHIGMSEKQLRTLWLQGKLNAVQVNGKGSTILVDVKNPFDVDVKPRRDEIDFQLPDDVDFQIDNPGPESNLELVIHVNKIMLKAELDKPQPDKIAVNRYLKQLLDASKLLLQHEIEDNNAAGAN